MIRTVVVSIGVLVLLDAVREADCALECPFAVGKFGVEVELSDKMGVDGPLADIEPAF